MQIEVVTIGDELMLGFTVDTNAGTIARKLAEAGVEITWRTTVGDSVENIAMAVRIGLDRTGAVVTTGGLGPTADDMTRETIADIFGRRLVLDEERLARLRKRWEERRMHGAFPESNVSQAMIPEGADVLENRRGTAPGLWLEDDRNRWVAMLPGVPREMRGMLEEELIPRIVARMGSPRVIRSLTLRTTGIAESSLAELIGDEKEEFAPASIAFLPGADGVDLRLTVRGETAEASDVILEGGAAKIRARVGRYLYGEGTGDLAAAVVGLCRAGRQTVAIAESCTGGLLGARLTEVAGASDVFLGGVVAYDNRVKREQLAITASDLEVHGAVSEPVAQAMARGVRERLGATLAVAITGIAGPTGGTPEKPVGTVCVAVEGSSSSVRTFRLVGDRAEIRHRAAQAALAMMRAMLMGHADERLTLENIQ